MTGTRTTTISALAAAIAARDGCTGRHIERVRDLGLLLAAELAPSDLDDPQLAWGFLLHDIGKLAVPDAILLKPGPLDDREQAIMRRHPVVGAEVLADLAFLGRAIDVVRHHHERWDGGGYPDGLAGVEIPLWARMFAVVDAVDAMTSDRPYQRPCTLDAALGVLSEEAESQFDPFCVDAFLRLDRARVEGFLEQRDALPLRSAA
jgi:ribonuclease P protein subunit RPR2